MNEEYAVWAIGVVRSPIKTRGEAPSQGPEGGPDVWLEMNAGVEDGLDGTQAGSEIIVVTWLHESSRDVLRLHPRWDPNLPLTGVFNTRSPDRPNPIGLHKVTVKEITGTKLRVGPMEAIDGTPVIDIKPVISADA